MKFILFVLVVVNVVFGDEAEQKIFLQKHQELIEKYKNEDKKIEDIPDINIAEFNKNIDISDTVKRDIKSTVDNIKKDSKIEQEAKQSANIINTKEFKQKHNEAKEHLLYDKKLNWEEQASIAKQYIQKKGSEKENFYVNSMQTIYIVISSSMPKATIKNYLESTKYIQDNVVFVLQGGIGGMQKIMPTLNWIKELLGDKYLSAKFIIDPKLTKMFNINQVPALIYTQKNLFELQSEQIYSSSNQFGDTYIFYGDMPIKYILEQLNNKKANQFISHLIRQLETK